MTKRTKQANPESADKFIWSDGDVELSGEAVEREQQPNLLKEALSRELYVTDDFEYVRTEPTDDGYKMFIKTTRGEHEMPFDSVTGKDVLSHGREIGKDEYDGAVVKNLHQPILNPEE